MWGRTSFGPLDGKIQRPLFAVAAKHHLTSEILTRRYVGQERDRESSSSGGPGLKKQGFVHAHFVFTTKPCILSMVACWVRPTAGCSARFLFFCWINRCWHWVIFHKDRDAHTPNKKIEQSNHSLSFSLCVCVGVPSRDTLPHGRGITNDVSMRRLMLFSSTGPPTRCTSGCQPSARSLIRCAQPISGTPDRCSICIFSVVNGVCRDGCLSKKKHPSRSLWQWPRPSRDGQKKMPKDVMWCSRRSTIVPPGVHQKHHHPRGATGIPILCPGTQRP